MMLRTAACRWSIPVWTLILLSIVHCPRRAASQTTLRVPQDHATIQEAIDAADGSAGDTVLISCGTYHESIIVVRGKSGIIIRSESGDPDCVTIDADGAGRVL